MASRAFENACAIVSDIAEDSLKAPLQAFLIALVVCPLPDSEKERLRQEYEDTVN